MRLTFPSLAKFASVWQEDFLGQQGFLLPPKYDMPLGQEVDLEVLVQDEKWGRARMLPIWSNRYGPNTEATPQGVFLRLIRADDALERRLRGL